MILRRLLFVSLILLSISNLYAQIPRTLSYQAVLTDNVGVPKPDGAYTVTFRLYTAVSGGVALWTESQSVQVKRGLFSAVLGTVTPLGANLTFAQPYWLSLQVAPDAEMTPRLPLTSVGYSFNSLIADGQVVRGINNLHDAVTLEAAGGASITSNGNTLTINAGSGGGGVGIQGIQNTDNTLTILNPNGPTATVNIKDPLVLNGLVGLGVTPDPALGIRLTVNGTTRFTPGGNGGYVQIGTPNGETGLGVIGANSRFDLRFDGGAVKLAAGLGTGPPDPRSGVVITTDGNVGIGNSSPTNKLTVGGGLFADTKIEINAGGDQYAALRIKNNQRAFLWQVVPSADVPGGRLRLTEEVSGLEMISVTTTGLGLGTRNPSARLEVIGRTKTGSLEITAGSDLAEPFDTETDEVVEPGSLMVIDAMNPGKLKLSDIPYDAKVAGIVSGAGNIKPGITLQQDGVTQGHTIVAIAGRVYCKADAHSASIEPGDLLTTSNIPGHAMKATARDRSHGAIIGKAMSSLKSGTGLVLVLVNLQ